MTNVIDERISKVVSNLLKNGYLIHPTTMSGTEGEMAKVDLCKGDTLVRVLVTKSTSDWGSDYPTLTLTVGQWKYPLRSGKETWNKDFEISSMESWADTEENF